MIDELDELDKIALVFLALKQSITLFDLITMMRKQLGDKVDVKVEVVKAVMDELVDAGYVIMRELPRVVRTNVPAVRYWITETGVQQILELLRSILGDIPNPDRLRGVPDVTVKALYGTKIGSLIDSGVFDSFITFEQYTSHHASNLT